ncbi:DUF1499 domain-containing protein [uncultured Roseobacter sp.]|uniref:DUF1499 domain-containing protein n=1 Tax=uncultured Roseobacter sp. TaxID=114847 RepID=UPI00261CDC7F|nr:DUF1499 domain-containing protein [uncultured Roseobacter sp.]
MRMGTLAVALLLLFGLGYVRLAPINPARWHQPVPHAQSSDFASGAMRVIPGDAGVMQQVDAVLRALPRTQVLAGSVEAGRITYVTRSAVFGFPDMTTVEARDGHIRMFARLRFGVSDLGVNRERLERVITMLQGG